MGLQFKIFIFFFITLTTVFSASNKEGWSAKSSEVFNEILKATKDKSSDEDVVIPPSFWHPYTSYSNRRMASIGLQRRLSNSHAHTPFRRPPPLWNEDAFITDYDDSEY